jgi:hypothetical protein
MRFIKVLCLTSILISNFLFGKELQRRPELRFGSLQEYRKHQALLNSRKAPTEQNPVSKSDLGLQRPVETKDKGFGYHFSFESKVQHSNNPGSSPDSAKIIDSSGIWENLLSNSFLLGAYDMGGASFSPILGFNLSNSKYFGDDSLVVLDSSSLNISFVGIFQFANGWSTRGGLSTSFDFDNSMTQTYRQTAPTIGLSKGFNIGKASAFADLSLSYYLSNTQFEDDKMNRFETALLWGIQIPIGDFEISPYLRLSYTNYKEDRADFTANAGIDFSYYFYEWLAAKFLISYSNRSTSGTQGDGKDFTRLDFGGAISLNAQF